MDFFRMEWGTFTSCPFIVMTRKSYREPQVVCVCGEGVASFCLTVGLTSPALSLLSQKQLHNLKGHALSPATDSQSWQALVFM